MTDSLRTRIAAVLYRLWRERFPRSSLWEELPADEREPWLTDADAVIAELKLQPETLCNPGGAILTRLDGRVLADNRYMRRWATPWECDESPVK